MKIRLFGTDGIQWSIDSDRSHAEFFLRATKSVELVRSVFRADVLWFVWHRQLLSKRYYYVRLLRALFGKKIVAVYTNDVRHHENIYNQLEGIVDFWIAPNSIIYKYLKKKGKPVAKIPFYASPETFHVLRRSKEAIVSELGIPHGVIKGRRLIGSFQRDTLEDLKKPKWHKNPDRLVRMCGRLDPAKYLLVIAGPRRHYLVRECRQKNIPYLYVGDESVIDNSVDDLQQHNFSEKTMNVMYNLVDVYVVSSDSESGPKGIIEAALTDTMVVSTRVGMAEDLLPDTLLYDDDVSDSFLDLLLGTNTEAEQVAKKANRKITEHLAPESYRQYYTEALKRVGEL